MRVKLDDKVRAIQTVVGRIRGAVTPDEQVVLGNHRERGLTAVSTRRAARRR